MEAHLLAALTPSVQHFILIGDHEQLRPSMSVNDLKNKGIDISMFERLVQNNFPYSILNCQRRMRPEIRKLVRPIYKDLTDHESVRKYDNVRGFFHNVSWSPGNLRLSAQVPKTASFDVRQPLTRIPAYFYFLLLLALVLDP